MKISWTPTARMTYLRALDYIYKQWTFKEAENFIYKTEHTVVQLAEHLYLFKVPKKKKRVRKGLITEHDSLYYRVKPRKEEIKLMAFRDNRQDPIFFNLFWVNSPSACGGFSPFGLILRPLAAE
jgi:plasmid stabilization system protein ParE